MNQEELEKVEEDRVEELLTIADIQKLPETAIIPGFKGVLQELEPRKGKTSRRHFFIGHMTDRTGRIRVTFFRQDVETMQGHLLELTSDHNGRGLRKDIYNDSTEMTVFPDAKIVILNPDANDIEKQVQKLVSQQTAKYGQIPAQTLSMLGNASSRIVSAFILTPSMSNPIKWLYSENFPKLVDRVMTVYLEALHKQQPIQTEHDNSPAS